MSNFTFICPYPLVYADGLKSYDEKFTTHWAYKDGNCAIRCPSVVLTVSEFDSYNDNVNRIAIVSLVLSLFVLVLHLPDIKRYYVRVLFISGFALSSICFVFFIPYNKDYKAICSDDLAHYIEQEPVCVLQATLLVFSFLWIALWGAVYAVDTYLVTLLLKKSILTTLRSYYTWFVTFTAALLASIGLMKNAYGYDYTTSLPNCMYLFAEGRNDLIFWWALLFPYSLCITICIVASLGTAYRLHSVFIASRQRRNGGMAHSGVVTGTSRPQRSVAPRKNEAPGCLPESTQSTVSEWLRKDALAEDGVGREWSVDVDQLPSVKQSYNPGLSGYTESTNSGGITAPSATVRCSADLGTGTSNPLHSGGGEVGEREEDSTRLAAVPEGKAMRDDEESIVVRDESSTTGRANRWDECVPARNDSGIQEGAGVVRGSEPSIQLSDYKMGFMDDDDSGRSSSESDPEGGAESQCEAVSESVGRNKSVLPPQTDSSEASSSFANSVLSMKMSQASPTGRASLASNAWLHTLSWTFSETWKYNGRVLIFIGVYCALSLYVIPTFIFLFHSTYDRNVQSTEDWVGCLVVHSFASPVQTQDGVDEFTQLMCGKYPDPRPEYSLMVSICYWGAGFGIISAVIFGSSALDRVLQWAKSFLPPTRNHELSTP